MNPSDFNKLVENRLEDCKKVLCTKEEEYSSDKDRLHNFTRAGEMLGTTTELALLGMWSKHLISVMDLLHDPSKATPHLLKEKFGDVINYALLAEATITDKMKFSGNTIDKHVQSHSMHFEPKENK